MKPRRRDSGVTSRDRETGKQPAHPISSGSATESKTKRGPARCPSVANDIFPFDGQRAARRVREAKQEERAKRTVRPDPATRARAEPNPTTRTGDLKVQSNLATPSMVLPWERELLLSCAPQVLKAILGDEDDDDDS